MDLDSEFNADMLHSVSRRRSEVGAGRVDPDQWTDQEDEEESNKMYDKRPEPFNITQRKWQEEGKEGRAQRRECCTKMVDKNAVSTRGIAKEVE